MIKKIVVKNINELKKIKKQSANNQFEKRLIHFLGHEIFCNDLASFYITAKDIFVNKIYDFNTKNKTPFIIDGGAHIGLFSIYMKLKFPDARILAFEPDPDALKLFKKNILKNNLKKVQIVEGALTDKNGKTVFSTGLSDGCTIFSEENKIEVTTYRLNDFVELEVDCLKLNIEGSEYDVIKNLEPKLYLTNRIYIEYHGFPETGQTLHKILDILDRNKFRYIIHDYDHETSPYSKPPLKLDQKTKFFLLIYAVNLNSINKTS